MAKKDKNEILPFEDALKKLESIVEQLESGELSLAQSLESFEDGMKLAKSCEDQLNAATGRVEKIMKDFAGKEQLSELTPAEREDIGLGDEHDL